MGPPKKRWKTDREIDATTTTTTSTTTEEEEDMPNGTSSSQSFSSSRGHVIKKVKDLCKGLSSPPTRSDGVGDVAVCDDDDDDGESLSRILQLKALQGQLLHRIQQSETILQQQAAIRDRQSITLDNLKAQVTVNLRSVEQCGVPTRGKDDDDVKLEETLTAHLPELIKLVKSATSTVDNTPTDNTPTPTTDDSNNDTMSQNATVHDAGSSLRHVLSDFFDGADIFDPEQHDTIMSKLNTQLESRKELEQTLYERQEQLKTLQTTLSAKQKFIRDLPHRLDDIERASLPLQKLCQKEASAGVVAGGSGGGSSNISSSDNNSNPKTGGGQLEATTSLIGTDRRRRFEMAETLPKPLYSLFYQIQSCLDTLRIQDSFPNHCLPALEVVSSSASSSLSGSSSSSSPVVVLLKIPLPDVSNSGIVTYQKSKKLATITFEYDQKTKLIVTSCSTEHGAGHLVDELFPGDDGEDGRDVAGTGKFVFQWSNYLAGMHFVPSEQTPTKMRQSTSVIIKALIRRARAVATLNRITISLAMNSSTLVTHPDLKSEFYDIYRDYGKTKISWTKIPATTSSRTLMYEVMLENFGAQQLRLIVSIDLARYPSAPPHWTLSPAEATRGGKTTSKSSPLDNDHVEGVEGTTLYDVVVEKILQKVNRNVSDLVLPNVEESYDWILVQQLASLAQGWNAPVL